MYNNIVRMVMTYYWKGRFNCVLVHLKRNFTVIDKYFFKRYEDFPRCSNGIHYGSIFHTSIYLFLQGKKRNYCTFCNSKYIDEKSYLESHVLSDNIAPSCFVLDYLRFREKYNWIYEGYMDTPFVAPTMHGGGLNHHLFSLIVHSNEILCIFYKPLLT